MHFTARRFSGGGVRTATHQLTAHRGPGRGGLLGNWSPQFVSNEAQIKQQSLENVARVWIVSHKLSLLFFFVFFSGRGASILANSENMKR